MTIPEIVLCPDGHFRRVIWGLGPYIADYPEQVLISCIVQGWCPKSGYLLCLSVYCLIFFHFIRCRALSGQLDSNENMFHDRRSRAHTDFVATRCEMGVLYENYGIIGDVIVRFLIKF